jgi:hypothetical protein
MKKIGYILVIAVFLFLSLIFLRNLFIYQPMLHLLEKRFEKKWGCKVAWRKADFNLLKGSLTVKDARIMGPGDAVLRSNLTAHEIFIQVDYPSLISGNTVLNALILDKVIFRQGKKGGSDVKKKDISAKLITKNLESKHPQKTKDKPGNQRKGTLVRYLLIRDGYFEFYYPNSSEKKGRLKLEHVNLSKKEVFLDRKLDVFFLSLFDSLEQ